MIPSFFDCWKRIVMESPPHFAALQRDVVTWTAIDNGRQIVFASFSLMLYEYAITLDQEVKYFWSGKWTPSRVLYLVNRYLPLVIMAMLVVCFNASVSLTL
ncbi:hypothetical protein Hypma_005442 [Hypsizygus marmoreus]|uniref:DUF6533 domain-containing protein n=1 Tax=Hypsizygus marmoreus TaxID=39966 RepID=A0A369IZ82_HYPMA|nr:hypothetical protein Hypma_005442 [Hypsizygus marmoreus]